MALIGSIHSSSIASLWEKFNVLLMRSRPTKLVVSIRSRNMTMLFEKKPPKPDDGVEAKEDSESLTVR